MMLDPHIATLGLRDLSIATWHDEVVYAIGDVHGCEDEYRELVQKCKKDALDKGQKPIIVQLGDMIDRGPGFYDLLVDDPADFKIMGNHEFNFLIEALGYKRCNSKSRFQNHLLFEELTATQKTAVLDKLRSRKKYLEVVMSSHTFVLSHAPITNIERGWYNKDTVWDITHKFGMSDFCMRSREVHSLNQDESVTFVHGHMSWDYILIEEQIEKQQHHSSRIFNIDSGCVYGKELIALKLPTLEVIRVQSNIELEY